MYRHHLQVTTLKPTEFKRLCGMYPDTFKDMVTVSAAEKIWQKKTSQTEQIEYRRANLMALEYYWREHRTYFQGEHSWGVNESKA